MKWAPLVGAATARRPLIGRRDQHARRTKQTAVFVAPQRLLPPYKYHIAFSRFSGSVARIGAQRISRTAFK